MNKRIVFLISLIFIQVSTLWAQGVSPTDTLKGDTVFYQSVFNLRPVILNKGKMLLNVQLESPRYYKVYNPKADAIEKLSSVVVLNEFYFNTYFTYGLSGKWNVYAKIPVVDIHHYSPMIIQSGVGLGDLQFGTVYQLMGKNAQSTDFLSLELRTTLPTGRHRNLAISDYPTGGGSFALMLALNGLHKFKSWDLWYSAQYDYRINHSGISVGDEAGIFATMQKSFNTSVGNFGVEGGLNSFYDFPEIQNGKEMPNSRGFQVNLYAGGWYKYLDRYYLRFGVPYSVYQNKSWMTQYRVMIQIDYLIN